MPQLLRGGLGLVALALLVLATSAAGRAETPIPAAPTAWVTDTAGFLSAQSASTLNGRLRAYERQTGHQILVYIAPTTGGVPIEDWAVRAFEQWKVGRKGLDDGLVLFIFVKDRTLRFEVGYGLESKVPDVLAARILRETVEPDLRAGQPDRAVTAGIDRILALTGGEAPGRNAGTQNPESGNASPAPLSLIDLIFIGLALLVFAIIAIRSPWLAILLLVNIFGGRGGSGGSGEGGFSGGGGRSGGGGASGRW